MVVDIFDCTKTAVYQDLTLGYGSGWVWQRFMVGQYRAFVDIALLDEGGRSAASDRERGAAAAGGAGVGVRDLEVGAGQVVDEIDLRAQHVHQRHAVDDDRGPVALDHHVAVLGAFVERELVLEPGAAAAGDADPQSRLLATLGLRHGGDAPGGARGELKGGGAAWGDGHARNLVRDR